MAGVVCERRGCRSPTGPRLFQPRATTRGTPRGDLLDQPASAYWSGGVFGVISECGTARLGSAAPAGSAPCQNSKTVPLRISRRWRLPPRSGSSPRRIAGPPPFDHRCDWRNASHCAAAITWSAASANGENANKACWSRRDRRTPAQGHREGDQGQISSEVSLAMISLRPVAPECRVPAGHRLRSMPALRPPRSTLVPRPSPLRRRARVQANSARIRLLTPPLRVGTSGRRHAARLRRGSRHAMARPISISARPYSRAIFTASRARMTVSLRRGPPCGSVWIQLLLEMVDPNKS